MKDILIFGGGNPARRREDIEYIREDIKRQLSEGLVVLSSGVNFVCRIPASTESATISWTEGFVEGKATGQAGEKVTTHGSTVG